MDASNFNSEYVNSFANAKAFINSYKKLDSKCPSDDEMIAIFNELHVVAPGKVKDSAAQQSATTDKGGVHVDTEQE